MKILSLLLGSLSISLIASAALAQPNPDAEAERLGRNNPCSDPWVSLAVSVAKTHDGVVGRASGSGNSDECNIKLYNGGHWGSYAELLQYVRQTQQVLASQNVRFETRNGVPALMLIDPSRRLSPQNIVSTNGSNILLNGGGNIVAQGGGNIVAQGGGNIVAQGGGNLHLMSTDGARVAFRLPDGSALRIK